MPIINRIAEYHEELTEWRRHIHSHPETAFEEHQTAGFVAKKLKSFGIDIHQGLAKTGVVGTLRGAHVPDQQLDCVRIWMHWISKKPPGTTMFQPMTVKCMPVAMMDTQQCCLAQPNI